MCAEFGTVFDFTSKNSNMTSMVIQFSKLEKALVLRPLFFMAYLEKK